ASAANWIEPRVWSPLILRSLLVLLPAGARPAAVKVAVTPAPSGTTAGAQFAASSQLEEVPPTQVWATRAGGRLRMRPESRRRTRVAFMRTLTDTLPHPTR